MRAGKHSSMRGRKRASMHACLQACTHACRQTGMHEFEQEPHLRGEFKIFQVQGALNMGPRPKQTDGDLRPSSIQVMPGSGLFWARTRNRILLPNGVETPQTDGFPQKLCLQVSRVWKKTRYGRWPWRLRQLSLSLFRALSRSLSLSLSLTYVSLDTDTDIVHTHNPHTTHAHTHLSLSLSLSLPFISYFYICCSLHACMLYMYIRKS